jgi:mono/diheme cytochrome c family protein
MPYFIRCIFALLVTTELGSSAGIESYLTFDNQPLGSVGKPLVMRTFLPNLDLDKEVLAHHSEGRKTPRYSAKSGVLSSSSEDHPVSGIPAGIAVNTGLQLSYVWDTTECRLLYAWNNGFLDMESYWGSPQQGSRKKNDYVPRLIGQLFYKAKGSHPVTINGKSIQEVKYLGHRRIKGFPIFSYLANGHQMEAEVVAGKDAQTLVLIYRCLDPSVSLDFKAANTAFEVLKNEKGNLKLLVRPNAAGSYTGYKKEVITIKTANAEAGEKLYTSFGCSACHTTDGSQNHGPSFQGLVGSSRELVDGSQVNADDEYLTESIKNPNAKHVKGFPAGMMPAYPLNDKQIESLVLYIQTLK